ncbi:GNAT family N-acetyltransferase [Maribacter thermophilus]|uniref:GNAT family N-acetyltransferase n=1 Tax=Maribacter thermophilus TaxID=1197874 RepID=UPI000640E469|nr:GNAT family N-acetyltransferase [Maribacter thermophilus]
MHPITNDQYQEVVDLWESSVRATHHFLKEEDILYFKPLILEQYLDAVELRCFKDHENKIIGFFGVAENNLEMLFVHPDHIGQGIGKALLTYAIEKFDIKRVDVNEQNENAVRFYQHFGFKTICRSATDPTGKPYPILHMQLN